MRSQQRGRGLLADARDARQAVENHPRSVAKSAYWVGRTPYFVTTVASVTISRLLMPRAV